MTILPHNHVIMCDIDSTLIMHEEPQQFTATYIMGNTITHKQCTTKFVNVVDPLDETKTISVLPNEPMIRILREELSAGYAVFVWSKGRYAWAVNVLKALNIDHPNLFVMSKPTHYLDDKPCQEWMGYQVYLPPDQVYKNKG